MDFKEIERELSNLRREKQFLEWLVVYLAKTSILESSNPTVKALEIQKEITDQWSMIVQHLLGKDPDSPQTVDIMLMAADMDGLTKNIVEEVKLSMELRAAEG